MFRSRAKFLHLPQVFNEPYNDPMIEREPRLAEMASLMGDPARANILTFLMDGRARTAKELSFAAGVSASTSSAHLARLVDGGLLQVLAQGRHRYFRIAGPDVAMAIESMNVLAAQLPSRPSLTTPGTRAMHSARTCYDHFAGRLGVAIHESLMKKGALVLKADGYELTGAGSAFFLSFGVNVEKLKLESRSFARPCLDWSERKYHLAGNLGAALACRCFELGWIARKPDTRAVMVCDAGRDGLGMVFGITVEDLAEPAVKKVA